MYLIVIPQLSETPEKQHEVDRKELGVDWYETLAVSPLGENFTPFKQKKKKLTKMSRIFQFLSLEQNVTTVFSVVREHNAIHKKNTIHCPDLHRATSPVASLQSAALQS